MKPIVVVGSGASAVHFALTALEKGREVLMLDVGRTGSDLVMPDASWRQLKDALPDPAGYFLGDDFQSVLYPGATDEYYGFPPSKRHVVGGHAPFAYRATGFSPLLSFAQGGLAEAWTGGVYPFNDAELVDFPFGWSDISPYYDLVAKRIGISGTVDDLARFMPVHDHLLPPLDLDEHSRLISERYASRRAFLNDRLGCYLGRSRLATLSRERLPERQACRHLGRCLWGCPTKAIYTPAVTLDRCRQFPNFRYVSGCYVNCFTVDRHRRVTGVTVSHVATGATEQVLADMVVLAAGTISTSRIFLESVFRATGEVATLRGLMDNRQILVPFVNLSMLRRPYNPDTYQYHQLGLGLEGAAAREYVHGQITTLKTAQIHAIVQRLPFDLKTSLKIFGNLHAALGIVNINLHDSRRLASSVTLEPATGSTPATLAIRYEPGVDEPRRVRHAVRRVKRLLRALNCITVPGAIHTRPPGAAAHYAGLLPMSSTPTAWTTSGVAESHEFENLFIADGSTFPFLPAKNVTFTLMANAARVADAVC